MHARNDSRSPWCTPAPSSLSTAARGIWVCALVVASVTGCTRGPQLSDPDPKLGEELRALTGARTRVVWIQEIGKKGDVFGRRAKMALIGLDSDDPRGERFLVKTPGHYAKPLITPKGDRVVFSNFDTNETFVVNWDGSGLRKIADGKAAEVWLDPDTDQEWVYIQRGPIEGKDFAENPIYRHLLDDPATSELAWDTSPVSAFDAGTFQLSADGERAVGLFPWPSAGVAEIKTGSWERISAGCWTGMSPDNSYRMWVFDGAHRYLYMTAPDGRTTAKIHIAELADGGRGETYHPRWSNHPRFLTLTSPYFLPEDSALVGTDEVEVVVGRFNADLTAVESWVTVSNNRRADYFPDMWVERDPLDEKENAPQGRAALASISGGTKWPGDLGGLVLQWDNAARKNAVVDPATGKERTARLRAHGWARYGRYQVMDMAGGNASFELERVEKSMLELLKSGYGISVEATIQALEAPSTTVPVITFDDGEGNADFTITQNGDRLTFTVRVTELGRDRYAIAEMGPIPIGESAHVAFTYFPYGDLRGFIDGEEVVRVKAVTGKLHDWSAGRLVFGGSADDVHWSGRIDGVAIYDSGLDFQQIEQHAELNKARIAERTGTKQIEVIARAEEVTRPPSPAAIEPYRRCLVVHRYGIEEVVSGEISEKEILVAHWAILDADVVREGEIKPGARYRLLIEPFEDHPELNSERMDMDSVAFDLPMFFDPLPGEAGSLVVDQELQASADEQ